MSELNKDRMICAGLAVVGLVVFGIGVMLPGGHMGLCMSGGVAMGTGVATFAMLK